MLKIETSQFKTDSRRVASRMLLEASRDFSRPEETAPASQVRKRTDFADIQSAIIGATVREMRIDANLRKTLFVPESEYLDRIRQQVVAETLGL